MAELTLAHSPLRLLFPIQSSGQALSLVLLFIVLGFGVVSVLRLTGADASAWILLPGLAGMLPSTYLALPGAFEIRSRGPARQLLADIEDIAAFLGYRVRTEELPEGKKAGIPVARARSAFLALQARRFLNP